MIAKKKMPQYWIIIPSAAGVVFHDLILTDLILAKKDLTFYGRYDILIEQ